MLFKVKEIDFTESAPSKESISDSFELLSIADSLPEDLNENDSYELKSEINSDEETVQDPVENTIKEPVEDRTEKNDTNIAKEMNSLECIFTWKLKSYKRNIISRILNEYGDYNLDISLPEFSLKR